VELFIAFEGSLDDNNGFYDVNYALENGTRRTMAQTQFEAAHAREAFPCMDEPRFKAQYEISLNVHDSFIALSNTQVDKKKSKDGRHVYYFKRSPPMPTYLVAFVIGELGTPMRHTFDTPPPPGHIKELNLYAIPSSKGKYIGGSLELSGKVLEHWEEWFKTPTGLEKLDLIALPEFNKGSREGNTFLDKF
jgi:tricorn protease interacting factor F2/3